MIEKIVLDRVIPEVFAAEGSALAGECSQVWLSRVEFRRGEDYLVVAESGAGKSSLCSYLYGSRVDYRGRILFDGEDVGGFSPDRWSQLRRRSLAYLPQQLSLFGELTAMENIMLKNRLTDFCSEGEIKTMLERIGVAEKIDTRAAYLSIGQQQRVAIVRALCQPMDFLLLDEPVSHLDERNNLTVAELIKERVKKQGAAIVVTSVGNHLALDRFKTLNL